MAGLVEGTVALVTGGSSGIGRASALEFAKEGAKVVVADVDVEGGEKTVHMITEASGEAIFVETDVSKAPDVEAMVSKAMETYAQLDYAHNNAGVEGIREVPPAPIADCTEENWDYTININLKGIWLCMKYEIPRMVTRGGGAIVNTSSVLGLVGGQLEPAYVASKHGVVGLTRAAALEYAQSGIRVNAVCPGFIRTPSADRLIGHLRRDNPQIDEQIDELHPLGRIGAPEEVARVVVWLCSSSASFVTGHAMAVDGGFAAQ